MKRYGVRRLDAVLGPLSSGFTQDWALASPTPPLTTETRTQAVENGVEPPYSILLGVFVGASLMEYGGSTPFSTTAVQHSPVNLHTPIVDVP